MCTAHSRGARVVADGRPGVAEALANADTRTQWVSGPDLMHFESPPHTVLYAVPPAQTHGSFVVLLIPLLPAQVLDAVRAAKAGYMDGINFDLEGPAKVWGGYSTNGGVCVLSPAPAFSD